MTRFFFSGHIVVDAPNDLAKRVAEAMATRMAATPELTESAGLFGEVSAKVADLTVGSRVKVKEAPKTPRKARAARVAAPAPAKSPEPPKAETERPTEIPTAAEVAQTLRELTACPFNPGDKIRGPSGVYDVVEIVGELMTVICDGKQIPLTWPDLVGNPAWEVE